MVQRVASALPPPLSFAALLLAGGRSRRMGTDKAWLQWQGQPLWERQVTTLRALQPQRLLVASRVEQALPCLPGMPAMELLPDPPGEDIGPLGALIRALEQTPLPLLVLAVDLPKVTSAFLAQQVLEPGAAGQATFLRTGHGLEPLIGLYTPTLLPLLRAARQAERYGLQPLLEQALQAGLAQVRSLAPEQAAALSNLNTPEEWDRAHEKGQVD